MDRSNLVKQAIKEAKERNTIVKNQTVVRFYKKNNAVWCEMVTGCIRTNSRVYKINTEKPYIRGMGCYWYLGQEEKDIIANM